MVAKATASMCAVIVMKLLTCMSVRMKVREQEVGDKHELDLLDDR